MGELWDFDTPTPFRENVYLGCGQHDIKPPKQMLADKQALYKTLHADVVHNKSEGRPVAEDLDEPANGLTERGEKTGKRNKGWRKPQSAKRSSSKPVTHEVKAYQYGYSFYWRRSPRLFLKSILGFLCPQAQKSHVLHFFYFICGKSS